MVDWIATKLKRAEMYANNTDISHFEMQTFDIIKYFFGENQANKH